MVNPAPETRSRVGVAAARIPAARSIRVLWGPALWGPALRAGRVCLAALALLLPAWRTPVAADEGVSAGRDAGAGVPDGVTFFQSPAEERFCRTSFDPFGPPTAAPARTRAGRIGTPGGDRAAARAARRGRDAAAVEARADDRPGAPFVRAAFAVSRSAGVELGELGEPEDLHRLHPPEPQHSGENLIDPFRFPIEYVERPAYLPDLGYVPSIDASPRRPLTTARQRAVQELVRKEVFRQVRRFIKRDWRRQFREDFSMSYAFYQSRLTRINQIGKDAGSFDPSNIDYFYNQTRNDALQRSGLEGEKELNLLEWGPLKVDDRGSLSFDLRSFFRRAEKGRKFIEGPRLAAGNGDATDPLISGRFYRVKTKLKINFNPLRGLASQDVQDTVTSYGGVVEVDFLSDILKRKLFTTEFEGVIKRDGRWGVFFNLVFEGRR